MASNSTDKRTVAQRQLREALAEYADTTTALRFLTVVKAFEVLLEYEWRDLKRWVESEGLEAQSPKMAIKQAAKLGGLDSVEDWLACLDARNNSVHDYFGISNAEYLALAKQLLRLSRKRKSPA